MISTLPDNHQEMLDAEHHKEFFEEHPHLAPQARDTSDLILSDFYDEYSNLGDRVYDEELGELFSSMMARYKEMIK